MPETQKIHPDSDYANSTVPTGALLIFLGYDTGAAGGNVVQRYKDSSGNFGTLAGAGGGSVIEFAQTTAEPSGNTVTVQAVTLGTDGAATASGDPVSAFYTWDLLTAGGN
jgi:hypothetical protein